MTLLEETIKKIKPLNQEAMEQAKKRWSSIAKPLDSLGLLEPALVRIAGITGSPKIDLEKKQVLVYCADNGVVEEGVTQTSQDVTAVVTKNLTIGATSVCQMAKVAGAQVVPVDVGVAQDLSQVQGLVHKNICHGTKNFAKGPAMSREEAMKALEIGIEMAYAAKKQGVGLAATGEMGIGNTTTSSAVAAALLGQPATMVTGRGAGLDTAGLRRKVAVIETALAALKPNPQDPIDVLSKVGGLDIAAMAGTFLGGAAAGLPVLIDGFISAVAALVAVKLCPTVQNYLLASHVSKEPAGQMMMEALGLQPVIHGQMCLGEGTGAVAMMPLLEMAAAVYTNMSTFSQIEIEEYKPLQ